MREKINESKKEPLKIQGFTITTLLAYLFNLWFGSCYNDFGSTEI